MSEIAKTYEPAAVEAKWYEFWLQQGCFTADPARVSEKRPAYSIVIPPPNVTGVLTLGHVLNNTIQDILARRARMLGKEVLWLPGTDHAGIATQTVVERTLKKQGIIRHRDDLGREKFVEKVWEWKEKHGGIIIQQLKKLGCSCDWSRERFTMDPEYSRCVSRVFVDLYKKGLIYRGKRMVNWCPASLTALSDEEVVMKPQNGTMYHFKVEVVSRRDALPRVPDSQGTPPSGSDGRAGAHPSEWLTIATTRPETIPGDTAVAVNPKDPRYAHLIGQHVIRPLPVQIPDEQKLIPIIGDEQVDFAFGTGVLKVTPAHDKADFEIGQRHGLAAVDIMNPDGSMNALAGESLAGLDRFEARNVAVEHLRQLGVLVKEEPYQNNVGYSERADVPIEPRLSEQWFLKYPSVEQARAGVADGAMKFFPERWAKVYDHWLGGIQDWCISRQLWWGHRVPVWYRRQGSEPSPSVTAEAEDEQNEPRQSLEKERQSEFQTGQTGFQEKKSQLQTSQIGVQTNQARDQAAQLADQARQDDDKVPDSALTTQSPALTGKIHVSTEPPPDLENWEQDPDVLDTWFSSWLWPFATMGWPEKTDTLAKFYPTNDLVTGPDIIFFWVARMIMAGFEYMGELPFRIVYFTGIIRDKQGRKMSKSLGNSPDPLDLIATYGADALRFGVMRSAPLGADILFDEKNVELGRNFCTKLWNAVRFRQMQGGETEGEINPVLLTSDDKWILLRLDAAIREVSTALDEYRFSDAAQALYRFFWSEYCDWYLEASKAVLNGSDAARKANALAVIDFVLGHTLRLFHPFLPFITEELWHGLGFREDLPADQGGRTIMFARWPEPLDDDFKAHYGLDSSDEEFAAAKYEVVNLGRGLRRDFNIASNKRVRFVLKPAAPLPAHEAEVLRILLNAEPLDVLESYDAPRGTPTALTPLGELLLPLEGLIDVAAERERLTKEIAKVEDELAKVRAKLANPSFTQKVPPAVLDEHRQREATWAEKLAQLQRMREALGES
jgi:valyl-tRNA synthetase